MLLRFLQISMQNFKEVDKILKIDIMLLLWNAEPCLILFLLIRELDFQH